MRVYYYGFVENKDEKKQRDEETSKIRKERENKHQKQQAAELQSKRQRRIRKWKNMYERRKAFVVKAYNYLKAEWQHARRGPTPKREYKRRVGLCMSCPGRTVELEGLKDDGGVGFCTKCGCPASQRSKLSVKLTIAGVTCPLKRFGPVKGDGRSIVAIQEAAKGVYQTVKAAMLRRKKR